MLYVVHCVDTEGPLWEPIEQTFERLNQIFGINLASTPENLRRIQEGKIDLGAPHRTGAAALAFSPTQLAFLSDWDAIDRMLDRVDKRELRFGLPDTVGNGWTMNWHCLAHHGFDPQKNPRRRDLGFHNVFDRYRVRYLNSQIDRIHWHFHPVPIDRQANHTATRYFTSPAIFEIISRRVLERMWFPCVNRPGFHSERPDSHWFLEQWLPFDIANLASDNDTGQEDLSGGRWGDWRRATKDWAIYHPDHDDYQIPGNCRRAIARCQNLEGRLAPLTSAEIEKAFIRAERKPTLLAFVSHDYRDLESGIRFVQKELAAASSRHTNVRWQYSDAAEAMRSCLNLGNAPAACIALDLESRGLAAHHLKVSLDRKPFGPQPWFCFALDDGTVHYDNLDVGLDKLNWHYTFDEHTAPIERVKLIGVATNTANGRTSVVTFDPRSGKTSEAFYN